MPKPSSKARGRFLSSKIYTLAFLLFGAIPAFAIDGGHRLGPSDPLSSSVVQIMAVQNKGGQIAGCSGTFIAPTLVITAAHCFMDNEGKPMKDTTFLVHRGDLEKGWMDGLKKLDASWAKASKVKTHPKFHPLFLSNDMALVKVEFKSEIESVKPLFDTSFAQKGAKVRLVGAGPMSEEEGEHHLFRHRTIDAEITGRVIPVWGTVEIAFIESENAEHGPDKNYTGLDHGDSGGGAFITIDGVEYLWGVDSAGSSYIGLGYMADWVKETAAKMGVKL